MRVALANIDNMQIEIIQPMGGEMARIYADSLPADGNHANVFHHICVKVDGALEDWDAYFAKLAKERQIVFTLDPGPEVRVVYTDERATLGTYLEHIWYDAAYFSQFSAMVPTYRSASAPLEAKSNP